MYFYETTNFDSALLGVGGALVFQNIHIHILYCTKQDTKDASQSDIFEQVVLDTFDSWFTSATNSVVTCPNQLTRT